MKFSDVVSDAKAKGYTEPDPREDLSGERRTRHTRYSGHATMLPSKAVPVMHTRVQAPLQTLLYQKFWVGLIVRR